VHVAWKGCYCVERLLFSGLGSVIDTLLNDMLTAVQAADDVD